MKLILTKIGDRQTNQYWPFTKEEFLSLKESSSWGQFEIAEKKRLKEIKQLQRKKK